jgi:hypothetical protein
MTSDTSRSPDGDRIGEVIDRVQLPLVNAEYALDQYLLANGQWLDTETRVLLAGVRDCIARVVVSTRRLSQDGRAGSTGVSRAA